jgi:hypothetical protein
MFVKKNKFWQKIFFRSASSDAQGFMLIEALTLLFVFSVVMVTFFSVLSAGLRYIQNSKNRLAALAVAGERMEIVRNLNYNNIGTVGGEISGNIPQNLTVVENGKAFDVKTLVEYKLDNYDGLYPPADLAFEDYKKVSVTVSWSSGDSDSGEVTMESRFVPAGLEVAKPGDGILLINVFSDQPGGTGIPSSSVHVVNAATGLDVEKETDASGNVYFIGDTIEQSIQSYEITLTKSGYETVTTLPPYPMTTYTPVDVHASVVTGQVNVKNIIQNELVNMDIHTIDYLGQPIPAINFHLEGGRKLGTSPIDPYPSTFNFNQDNVTDSDGERLFQDVSPGTYGFTLLDPALTNYEIIQSDPMLPFTLMSADGTLNVNIKLANKTTTSLMIDVLRLIDGTPLQGASVKATNSLGYDQTLITDKAGRVFFPVSADPFASGSYRLKIIGSGFFDREVDVTVNENELKKAIIYVI